jgi:hypothetical protein
MSKNCPKKRKIPIVAPTRTMVAEAQAEPALAYEGPSKPRDEGESQGNPLDMI